jgi:hypothetical protein
VNPPEHTIIIEADIRSSVAKRTHQKIKGHLRYIIITTCGDADVMAGTKRIDPALCLYVGAHLICIDNKHLKDKVPRGNGTICRVIGIKLKEQPQSYKWKIIMEEKCRQYTQVMLNGCNVNISTKLEQ